MWTLKDLQDPDMPQAYINGKWVPSRPENYKPKYLSFIERIKIIWAIWTGKAEAFIWPEDQ